MVLKLRIVLKLYDHTFTHVVIFSKEYAKRTLIALQEDGDLFAKKVFAQIQKVRASHLQQYL